MCHPGIAERHSVTTGGDRPGIYRTIYDPACGTGGMLSESKKLILDSNRQANLALFGQEYNDESWAICCSDMLIKDEDMANIVLGDTLGDGKTRDGYEDVNDADRLGRDPAMRWIVGGKAVERGGASTSQMGRFETELLANNENLAALADLSGMWIDRVHDHDPPRRVVHDMDSSVSPTFGMQESTAYNGHFGCTCYHPLFVFNQFGDLERLRAAPRQRAQRPRMA